MQKSSPSILHLNIRLGEGGAARMALQLHLGLLDAGWNSLYGYGYGRRANNSPLEQIVPNTFRVTNKSSVLSNYLFHRIFGIDPFPPSANFRNQLSDLIKSVDIVHLHAVHSHYLPLMWLLQLLSNLRKPIVWTAHDHWMVTGRCAILDHCDGWKRGCGECLTKKNYPETIFDYSAKQLAVKRLLIRDYSLPLVVVSPSYHLQNDIKIQYPNIKSVVIQNSVDDDFEKFVETSRRSINIKKEIYTNKRNILVIANDLAYRGKTDRDVVNRVAELNNVNIITIGKNSPFSGGNFINLGEITDRNELTNKIIECDAMLFTSKVDNFPLVIGEAHFCGIPVFATPSAASAECLALLGGKPLILEEILRSIANEDFYSHYNGITSPRELQLAARAIYGRRAMVNNYVDIYSEVIEQLTD